MSQSAAVFAGAAVIQVDLPAPDSEALPGVRWGAIEAFPTPAYWTYQVLPKRLCGAPPRYRLGATLAEEVGACLLGGHGIPAPVGIAAFRKLQSLGIFEETPTELALFELLSRPLDVDGRLIKYRFARQKAGYLSAALVQLAHQCDGIKVANLGLTNLLHAPLVGFRIVTCVDESLKVLQDSQDNDADGGQALLSIDNLEGLVIRRIAGRGSPCNAPTRRPAKASP